MISNRVRTAIIAVVTGVWTANFAATFVVEDYKPDQAINGIFMAVVGTLFALGGRKKDDAEDGGDSP